MARTRNAKKAPKPDSLLILASLACIQKQVENVVDATNDSCARTTKKCFTSFYGANRPPKEIIVPVSSASKKCGGPITTTEAPGHRRCHQLFRATCSDEREERTPKVLMPTQKRKRTAEGTCSTCESRVLLKKAKTFESYNNSCPSPSPSFVHEHVVAMEQSRKRTGSLASSSVPRPERGPTAAVAAPAEGFNVETVDDVLFKVLPSLPPLPIGRPLALPSVLSRVKPVALNSVKPISTFTMSFFDGGMTYRKYY